MQDAMRPRTRFQIRNLLVLYYVYLTSHQRNTEIESFGFAPHSQLGGIKEDLDLITFNAFTTNNAAKLRTNQSDRSMATSGLSPR